MSGTRIQTPIVIDDHGDVMMFETVEAARRRIEPIDVKRSEYVGYGSDGMLLRLSVDTTGDVVIARDENDPTEPDRLAAVIRQFLQRVGPAQVGESAETIRTMDLARLVQTLVALERRGPKRGSGVIARLRWLLPRRRSYSDQ